MEKKHKKNIKRFSQLTLSVLLAISMLFTSPLLAELPGVVKAMFPARLQPAVEEAVEAVAERAPILIKAPTVVASDGEEWGECFYCGEKMPAAQLCDSCEGCSARSEYGSWDCFAEHHCVDCGRCAFMADPAVYCEECNHCWHCWDWYTHCIRCGGHDVEHCRRCRENGRYVCLDCHDSDVLCDECGECFSYDQYKCTGNNKDEANHCALHCMICDGCGDCFTENASEWCELCNMCNECAYSNYRHCQECGDCLQDTGHCQNTNFYCPDCCESLFHCEICGECIGLDPDKWCETSGRGGHCMSCYEENACEQCGVCFICEILEGCPECGLCPDCCLENSQAAGCECATCVMDSFFEDSEHICERCGAFSCVVGEFCEECGLCTECCLSESESQGCDCGTCVMDSWFNDPFHICGQCGAFSCVEGEFCEFCELCANCCEENTEEAGCTHGVCVESWLWQEHYCAIDRCCYDQCRHTPKKHTHTYKKDGFYCDICHAAKDGTPYIYFQPRDVRTHTFDVDKENWEEHTVTFRVYASGEGNKYQWYYVINNYKPFAVTDNLAEGGKTSELTVYVPSESCHENYEFYCVITNAKGSVTSNRAKLLTNHVIRWNDLNGELTHDTYYHYYRCVGENCDHIVDTEKHRFGISAVVTAATQYTKGKIMRKCHICGYQEFKETPALGVHKVHDFKIFSNTRLHWSQCTCAQYGMPKQPHAYKATVKTAATETSKGVMNYSCYDCLYSYTKSVPKLEHTHIYWDGTVPMLDRYGIKSSEAAALCYTSDNSAYHHRKCIAMLGGKRCGYVESAKREHRLTEWKDFSYPSVTENGKMRRYCDDCGYTVEAPLTKNSTVIVGYDRADTSLHSVKNGDVVTLSYDFSRENYRLQTFTLEYRGAYSGNTYAFYKINVPAGDSEYKVKIDLQEMFNKATPDDDPTIGIVVTASTIQCNHAYGYETLPAVPSTCTEIGYWGASRCRACGYTIYNHEPDYKAHTIVVRGKKEATCYEDGYSGDEYCTVCEQKISTGTVIPKLKHTPVLKNNTAPTCGKSGYTGDYVCKYCSRTMTAGSVIAATGNHKLTLVKQKAATCGAPGVKNTYYTCSVCKLSYRTAEGKGRITDLTSYQIPATGKHDWDAGKVTKAATATEDGIRTYTCKVCKQTKTEVIPKTGSVMLGDVNGDGSVTTADARLCLRRAIDLESYPAASREYKACDVDKDGKVKTGDARFILRHAIGLNDPKIAW